MAGAVLSGGYGMEFGVRRGGGLGYKVVQSSGGGHGGDGLQERAAFDFHRIMVRGNWGVVKREINAGRVVGDSLEAST